MRCPQCSSRAKRQKTRVNIKHLRVTRYYKCLGAECGINFNEKSRIYFKKKFPVSGTVPQK